MLVSPSVTMSKWNLGQVMYRVEIYKLPKIGRSGLLISFGDMLSCHKGDFDFEICKPFFLVQVSKSCP